MEEIDRYVVRTDAGSEYTVVVLQEYIDTSTFDGPSRTPGLKRLRLTNGWAANYIDPETVKIVETDEIARKVR